MGTVINEFTCVEFGLPIDFDSENAYEEVAALFDSIEENIKKSEFYNLFNLAKGVNYSYFFTAAPSGSKLGWSRHSDYKNDLKNILAYIEKVSDFYVVKTVTTTSG